MAPSFAGEALVGATGFLEELAEARGGAFLELFSGQGHLTQAVLRQGYRCVEGVDILASPPQDLSNLLFAESLLRLLNAHVVRKLRVGIVCAT